MSFFAKNDLDLFCFTVYWRIENFNCEPGKNFSIKSPTFKIKTTKSKWYINIVKNTKYLGVYLFKLTQQTCCVVQYSLSFLKSKDWISVLTNVTNQFNLGVVGYGAHQAISLQNLQEEKWTYLPNGALTVSFRIWYNELKSEVSNQCLMISRFEKGLNLCHRPIEFFKTLKPNDLLSFPSSYEFHSNVQPFNAGYFIEKAHLSQLTQTDTNDDFKDTAHLLRLFKEKEFSFVTLRTPDRDFLVHKAVLCAKSPVFNAMFEKQMKENGSSLVDIDDIDSQTMSSLVQFLHLQPLDNLKWEAAVTLYYAADKYQIDVLKEECVTLLQRELSVENICDALLLADLHQDMELMSCAQDYFCRNSKLILISKHWKDFLCNTELVAELLHKLAEKM